MLLLLALVVQANAVRSCRSWIGSTSGMQGGCPCGESLGGRGLGSTYDTHTGLQRRGRGRPLVIRTAWCTRRTTHRGGRREGGKRQTPPGSFRALERWRAENSISRRTHVGTSLQADREQRQEAKRPRGCRTDAEPLALTTKLSIEGYDWAVRDQRLGLYCTFLSWHGSSVLGWRSAARSESREACRHLQLAGGVRFPGILTAERERERREMERGREEQCEDEEGSPAYA